MVRYSLGRSVDAVRNGALGLFLLLPILAASAQAQTVDPDSAPAEQEDRLEDVIVEEEAKDPEGSAAEAVDVDAVEVESVGSDSVETDAVQAEQIEANPAVEPYAQSTPLDLQPDQPRVLISEVVIEGIAGHPEQARLEMAAYEAMTVLPGSRVTRDELKLDLEKIYATGWFSDVRIEPINGPLGVQLVVQVEPNPLLTRVELNPSDHLVPEEVLADTFSPDYGRTLNLNELRLRMKELQKWYSDEGYSLARVSGPDRISPDGVVTLKVVQGTVAGVEVQFLNKDGDPTNEKGEPIKGKTRPWVVTREISLKPGDTFNRNQLEGDIKRIYGTSLFSDVKVTLKPVAGEPGNINIILGIVEQSTGSLSGGLGYSQGQGVFGQVQLQDSNLFGRAWNLALNITYGQYGGLANFTFTDPWIKGDSHRTSFRTSLFLAREVPQVFQSQNNGNIRSVHDYYDAGSYYAYSVRSNKNPADRKFSNVNKAEKIFPEYSWFDYEGDSVALQRVGGNVIFARPLNGGDPYADVPWNVLVGLNVANVRPINFSGDSRPYGMASNGYKKGKAPNDDFICIAYDCADENNLLS
ncbi:MAG TPA: POTRA domain-containing protein, partial [Prochlorococcaceae cyanobacterium Fu_MAG_50]|nr:POTRA domain-containing protein [Prochlorococcaceae cyanobacterium Fu_MAG_50]